MRPCDSEKTVIQNLRDAGCDEKTIAAYLDCIMNGRETESLRLLKKQRSLLLDAVHREERKIDCLDYLMYQMWKAKR
ncbi:MAG: hypothetical protein HFE44_14240 [Oscillospiraceae bacterium]|jgi:hypothetical protein|nr:hypothetical protein [Oscillospiraceae bacterium]